MCSLCSRTSHAFQSRLILTLGVDYYQFPLQIPCSCILRDMSCCGAATQFWSSCVACLLVTHSLEHRSTSQCTISIFLLATTLTYQQFQVRKFDTSRAVPTWALEYSRACWQLPAGSHTDLAGQAIIPEIFFGGLSTAARCPWCVTGTCPLPASSKHTLAALLS